MVTLNYVRVSTLTSVVPRELFSKWKKWMTSDRIKPVYTNVFIIINIIVIIYKTR